MDSGKLCRGIPDLNSNKFTASSNRPSPAELTETLAMPVGGTFNSKNLKGHSI